MGDEQIGQAKVLLQLLNQIQHLALHRNVQGAHRLVAHDELGLQGQRPGDADTLALAAGKLVGKAQGVLPGQAHIVEQIIGLFLALGFGHPGVDQHGFHDDIQAGHARIQRGEGILEDDLELAAKLAHLFFLDGSDILALVQNAARGGVQKPDQEPAGGGLSAAGFAHQAQGFAVHNFKGQPVDRLDHQLFGAQGVALGDKMLGQIPGLDQHIALYVIQ